MAARISLFSEFAPLEIYCQGDAGEATVWIRSKTDAVSLTLDKNHRDALRRVLDEADAVEASHRGPTGHNTP